MSGFINVPSGSLAADTYKDAVANSGALPLVGNVDGDLRVTLDTDEIYIWDATGSSWVLASGTGSSNSFETIAVPNGTSPVADSGTDTLTLTSSDSSVTISGNSGTDTVDFVLPSTIPGNKTFSGNISISSGSVLNLSGLQETGLSNTIVLVDNTSSGVAFSFVKTMEAVVVEYSAKRDSNRRTGRLLIVNNGSVVTITDDLNELLGPIGLSFDAVVNGANIDVQYTTTSNSFNVNFKYAARQWVA